MIHIINSPHNFSIQNCPLNRDRVQFRFQFPERCITKYLKKTKMYSIEFLGVEMTSYPSNYRSEYSPVGWYSLFRFEKSDVISVLKNSNEYSFVFLKCLIVDINFHRQVCFGAATELARNLTCAV